MLRDVTERMQAEEELRKHRDKLEEMIGERTKELEESNTKLRKRSDELEAFNTIMLDRESRIIEMKEEVNKLCKELGREVRYPPLWRKK